MSSAPRSTEFVVQTLPRQAELPPVSRLLVAAGQILARWEARFRNRHMFKRLDAHLLRDIGLSDIERRAECGKPFWRD